MASENRTATDPLGLLGALVEKPWEFDFFQALRRLECTFGGTRLGESNRVADDPIRLGQEPSLAFAPSTIAACLPGRNGRPSLLQVFFFGLFGPNGPLPHHLTEYARDRRRNSSDATFARFADVFHHRMLSLFYRAWARSNPAVSFDRPESDRFALYVGALMGVGMPSLRNRDELPDHARFHFAGALACPARHAEGLRGMVACYFGVPAAVEEFQGEWLELPVEYHARLGARTSGGCLGAAAVLGERVWSRALKFRLVLGPMSFDDYQRFLPDGRALRRLGAMVRSYTGDEHGWDVRVTIRAEEAPALALGGKHARLGWTTWLGTKRRGGSMNGVIARPTWERRRAAQPPPASPVGSASPIEAMH